MTSAKLFASGGEMGARMRDMDWTKTPLDPPEQWQQSLKTAVRIMLTSRQAMFVWWGEELINLYNDAYKAIVGGKHPKALGQPASVVWREIWDQVGPRAESAILKNEGTYDEALLLIMERNGYPEETYYTFSYSPVPDDEGGTGGIICANTDDTQRIIGERQLALLRELAARTADARTFDEACTRSAECLQTNLHDLPFAMIYLHDPDQQHVVLAGTSGIERSHAAIPETVDLNADSVWSIAEVLKTQQTVLLSDLTSIDDLPTGAWERSPHQAVVVPIAPSRTTGTGVLIVGLNPFRRFDDSYQRFIDLVAAQITASIANAQAYEEERKRAEALAEIDRAKTVFFSNVSHEFRTPLTLMLGPLEDLLTHQRESFSTFSTIEREHLETVHRNALRLLKLVNTLLDFSRIEAGRIQAVYEPTDLSAFTAELASVFRSAIERAGMRLIVDCPPLPEPVFVNQEMWEKIVLNLLSNAFKFTFEGEITISLRWASDRVELAVQDTGTGIAAEEIPNLFKRFHRVPGARGRTYEGSGIGLSLIQELVKLHGGTISVTSEVDRGTRFVVSIPTGSAHLPSDQIVATHTAAITATNRSSYIEEALRWLPEKVGEQGSQCGAVLSPCVVTTGTSREAEVSDARLLPTASAHILLVDDNADMRDYVKRLLSQQYQVKAVADGIAALEAIRQQRPDLVLTDVMMPRLDGFGLLRELRTDPITREIPIILLSARAGEESCVEGLAAGADDYLIKPFSARELLARVEASLKLARLRQEAAQREQTILERVTDAFVAFDRDLRFTYANSKALQIMRKTFDEIFDKTLWEVLPDLIGTPIEQAYRQAIAGEVTTFEEYYPPHDLWLEGQLYPSETGLSGFYRDITQRKHTEAVLRHSEEQFRQLANAMPQIVWIARADGEPEYVSQRWVEYTGLTLAQTSDRANITQVIHPDDLEPTYEIWQSCLATGSLYQTEFRLRRIDGTYRWFLCRAVPICNEQAQVVHWYGTLTDIDDRKRTEEALRQSESRFRLIVESAKDYAIFTLDLNGIITSWNSGAQRLLGYTEIEAIGCHGRLIFTPEDNLQNQADREMHIALHAGQAENERWHVRKDGSRFWASGIVMPLRDEADNVQGFVKIMQDKTTQRQANERLHLLYETTSHLLAAENPLAIMNNLFSKLQTELELHYYYNFMVEEKDGQQMLRLRNYAGISDTAAQAIAQIEFGQYICGLVAQERRQVVFDQAQIATHPNAQIIRSMGITAYASQPLIAQGRLLGTLSFASRTRQRFTPEEIDLLQATCDQVAVALERANLTTSLQQQAEQLQQANRIKDEFLAVLSHELRSPLNPILGWSKLLQTRKLDEAKTAQALATIERNAKLQSELIEDLLDVSRILQGKLNLNVAVVNLASTIQGAIETVRLAVEAKSIELTVNLDFNVEVSGDATRLQQVMWNLLSNAVKFTPTGGRVTVELTQVRNQAQIKVSDTGKGIQPDFLPHVFDYFRQEDGKTTRKFGGLGLGLAIVRHLVELHGGTVEVESRGENQGATFTVQLPLIRSEPTVDQNHQSSELPPNLNNVQVLVVDDDTDTRDFVVFVLEQAGATVISATSAKEAVVALTNSQPDVLVSDIGMPEMDGYMLMQHIRSQRRDIPAIALTAYAGDFNQQQALRAGFQQHITKPVEPETLVKAIATLIKYNESSI